MERFIKHLELKQIAIGAVLLLSLVSVGLTGGLVWNAYENNSSAKRLSVMNEISDLIITAAAFEALERGATATALSGDGSASADVIDKIGMVRSKGDEAITKALKMAEEMAAKELNNADYSKLLKKTEMVRQAHIEARLRVDNSLRQAGRDIQPAEWVKIVSEFIDAASRLRQAGFITSAPLQRITQANLIIKQAVWLASEYAGRERANLVSIIAARKPVPPEMIKKLDSFRSIVELSMKEILALRELKDTDERVLKAIKAMDDTFLHRFEEVRKQVYEVSETGQYPIGAREWIERSTEAINSILAVSTAVSQNSEEDVKGITRHNRLVLMWFLIQTMGGVFISTIIILTVHRKVNRIWHLHESMEQLSTGQGDLTFRLPSDSRDEIGKTAEAFNRFMEQLQNIIRKVKQATDQVASSSAELSATAIQVEKGSESQVEQAAAAASAMVEMKSTVADVAKNASEAASFSKSANTTAERGGEVITETVTGMQKIAQSVEGAATVISSLGQSSEQIGEIVSLINDIADQTNLLALNAAIEAARAGEQGRGFAVVADEVRKLAERTAKATAEIGKMIKAIQSDTKKAVVSMKQGTREAESGVILANEAGGALLEIVEGSQRLTDMISQIATAAEEQSAVSTEVSNSVGAISRVAKENNTAVTQIAGAADELLKLSTDLQKMVGFFNT